MPVFQMEIKPVERITVGAKGEPGHRTIYLQASGAGKSITLLVEKEQIQMLAVSVEQFLTELAGRFPELPAAEADYAESEMELREPIEPKFRAGNMGLGYDNQSDYLLLVVREQPEAESQPGENPEVSLWCTRSQLRKLAHWVVELAKRGRPICGNCGNPIDPEGHFCVKKNGHKH